MGLLCQAFESSGAVAGAVTSSRHGSLGMAGPSIQAPDVSQHPPPSLWNATKNLPLSRGHSGSVSPPEAHRLQGIVSQEPKKSEVLVSRDRTNPHTGRICPVVEEATGRYKMSKTQPYRGCRHLAEGGKFCR